MRGNVSLGCSQACVVCDLIDVIDFDVTAFGAIAGFGTEATLEDLDAVELQLRPAKATSFAGLLVEVNLREAGDVTCDRQQTASVKVAVREHGQQTIVVQELDRHGRSILDQRSGKGDGQEVLTLNLDFLQTCNATSDGESVELCPLGLGVRHLCLARYTAKKAPDRVLMVIYSSGNHCHPWRCQQGY